MTDQTEKVTHKDGPPWDNRRTFSTFGEADTFRKSLLTDQTKQVKVKRFVNSSGVETYVVKVRTNPALVPAEELTKKNKKNK